VPLSRRSFLQLFGTVALAEIGPRYPHSFRTDKPAYDLCGKLASDPLRPQCHLLPARNWMNDPNGPIFFRGKYHMFHQYNPESAVWGNMNWAHATSPDLIHWEHEPIALSPTPGGPDRDGVFSGSAVLDNGRPTVIYTGVAPPASDSEATLRDGVHTWRETQCLAVAQDDDLRIWKKLPEAVIPTPPPGLEVTGFRDPCIWREKDQWMLILGAGIRGKGGMILLYTSRDLRNWTYLHPLVEGIVSRLSNSVNPVDTGEMWECPDFFPLGDKHVLLISTMGKVRWKVGSYANQRFIPEKEGVVDWGSYYAAKTMLDAHGNRILWGWIPEARPDAELLKAGWAGAMSLPRTLSLSRESELSTQPAEICQTLRGRLMEVSSHAASRQAAIEALRFEDLCTEFDLQIQPKADEFALHLQSDDGDFVSISCFNQSGTRQLRVGTVTAPLPGASASVHLHMFLDGSVLEVFANDGTTLTARAYVVPRGPLRLKLDRGAEFVSVAAWQMKPISTNRLTSPPC